MKLNELDSTYYDDFYNEADKNANDYSIFRAGSVKTENLDPFDSAIDDIDFSSIEGKDFKRSFHKANRLITNKIRSKNTKISKKPLNKKFFVNTSVDIKGGEKKLSKVIVPRERRLIIQGASDLILDQTKDVAKEIGYHEGRELKQMVLTFNNDSALDFNLQIFNPSMPLDYLYSTSQNLNNKIIVGGGEVAYSDVLYNILANPLMIYNAKFTFEGARASEQISQSLQFINKNTSAFLKKDPVNLSLQIDPYQFLNNIVFFDLKDVLNRPFIPDGMDVIQYKVLPQMTIAMAFFYDQLQIKRIMYEQGANSKKLL
mgnify:CR=1 FL=1